MMDIGIDKGVMGMLIMAGNAIIKMTIYLPIGSIMIGIDIKLYTMMEILNLIL